MPQFDKHWSRGESGLRVLSPHLHLLFPPPGTPRPVVINLLSKNAGILIVAKLPWGLDGPLTTRVQNLDFKTQLQVSSTQTYNAF